MSDYKLTASGKMFFAFLVSFMSGAKPNMKLKGTPEQIEAMKNAIKASMDFQKEVKNPNATIDSIIEKMKNKNLAASEFKAKTNFPWPI